MENRLTQCEKERTAILEEIQQLHHSATSSRFLGAELYEFGMLRKHRGCRNDARCLFIVTALLPIRTWAWTSEISVRPGMTWEEQASYLAYHDRCDLGTTETVKIMIRPRNYVITNCDRKGFNSFRTISYVSKDLNIPGPHNKEWCIRYFRAVGFLPGKSLDWARKTMCDANYLGTLCELEHPVIVVLLWQSALENGDNKTRSKLAALSPAGDLRSIQKEVTVKPHDPQANDDGEVDVTEEDEVDETEPKVAGTYPMQEIAPANSTRTTPKSSAFTQSTTAVVTVLTLFSVIFPL
ncbi:hypothetical protein FOZ60_014453 [Perkinsus olseni]|uniref:Uncharacterized protein n=1 Tax=Perkinsus olseni TaxID=32597 RepID=A0A7J6P883_PEROL|nr:hypothetical protein FOZ60_014453 [Perkinsus olseni]